MGEEEKYGGTGAMTPHADINSEAVTRKEQQLNQGGPGNVASGGAITVVESSTGSNDNKMAKKAPKLNRQLKDRPVSDGGISEQKGSEEDAGKATGI